MKILSIETSCDETAVCLIEAEGDFGPPPGGFRFRVLGDALHSQIAVHAPYGGVFPDLAKREHAKHLVPLLERALKESEVPEIGRPTSNFATAKEKGFTKPLSAIADTHKIKNILAREPELFDALELFLDTHGRSDVDAIAVTAGPGLEPALWVGVNFAKALSAVWEIPIVAVNHLEGHIVMAAIHFSDQNYSSILQNTAIEGGLHTIDFPALALLISGGHTELDLMTDWMEYRMLGQTRDDAVGEAFDKAARMLGLPYPGGPHVAALAARARTSVGKGFTKPLSLPRPMMNDDSYDFSFSGLKTAVRNLVGGQMLSDKEKMAIAREFEDAAADVLVAKTARAVEEYGARTVLVGGGVSANQHIRLRLAGVLTEAGCQLLVPSPELATDNALMIALSGYFRALKKEFVEPSALRADGNLKLGRKI